MSIIPPALTRLLPFYLSGPLPCPYLPGQVEHKLFTRLKGSQETNSEVNATLSRAGFRRSHDVVYRPACNHCNACTPVRVPVQTFNASRSLRRIAQLNRDLVFSVAAPEATEELYHLFASYQSIRHPDSDMAHMSVADFKLMVQEGQTDTNIGQLRTAAGELVAAIITDPVSDGTSAVYSFYTPHMPRRSLGIQMILSLIESVRAAGQSYVYLGYWIAASRKMAYKSRFQPLQALGSHGWDWLDPMTENK